MTEEINGKTTTTPQEKGAAFLQWVAENSKEMRRALRKNCTYDPDLFEDVYNEAILCVHSTIVLNDRYPASIKNYFFSALKFQYRMRQNQGRKREAKYVRDYFDRNQMVYSATNHQQKEDDHASAIQTIKEVLAEEYGERWAEIFLAYWMGRLDNSTSYQEIATLYDLGDAEQLRIHLQGMRKFAIEECPYIKDIFVKDYGMD